MKNRAKLFCLGLAIAAGFGCLNNLAAVEAGATNCTQAILQHPGFREGLVWVGSNAPDESESSQLWMVVQNLSQPTWPADVERFLHDHPASPWAASLHHAYASFCQRTGRTTRALTQWEAGWQLVKNDTTPQGRRLGGAILAAWMDQLSSLGRREKLKELIAAGDHWPFARRQDREKFEAARHNYSLMGTHPEISFRCGTLALKAIGQILQPTNMALETLVGIPSPTNGFSMARLAELANAHGLDLVPARRLQGQELIVPSVVHWRQNHYAAILEEKDDSYLVNDPTFGRPKWLPAAVVNEEASGAFLIPASAQNSAWARLAPGEAQAIRGMGLPCNLADKKDKSCARDFSGKTVCTHCPGMPVWWVSEPYINLWIADEPLSYLTSQGEPFTFGLTYKQRGTAVMATDVAEIDDTGWNHSWFSYIQLTSELPNSFSQYPAFNQSDATLQLPGGGEVDFPMGQTYDQETRLLLQQTDPTKALSTEWFNADLDNGLRVIHADGSQDIYGFGVDHQWVNGDYPQANYLLTRHFDAHGNATSFVYFPFGNGWSLQSVVDPDGRTNTLYYTYNSALGFNALTAITNAYGQSAHFSYDANGNLTTIIDAAGLSSSLAYDTNGYPTNLITPYGTNRFSLYVNPTVADTNGGQGNFGGHNLVDRAALVTDPIGGQHLYLYRYDCSQFMATNYPAGDVPTGTPLGTLDTGTGGTNILAGVCYRNSFSWDARQLAGLSVTNLAGTNLSNVSNLVSSDFIRGRMKHWLQDTNAIITLSGYLSAERDPSPDGTTEGLKNFYDYQGKASAYCAGTNALPSVRAWRLPGGETHYEYVQFDYFGNITNRQTTYTTAGGLLGARTNQYIYGTDSFTNVWGTLDNSGNFSPYATNAFSIPSLLTRVIGPDGSNVWSFGGFDAVTWTNAVFNPNTATTNGVQTSSLRALPRYQTNGVNEVTTLTYAPFDRVTSIKWPAGLTTTNLYDTNGFRIQTIDQQINRTNSFAYSNGLLSTHTNELGLVVNFSWDNLLRLTGVNFPDNTTVSNVYAALDLSAQKDRLGNWTYFAYDGLQHLITVTNANNAVTSYGWCDCGALTSITDALTNTITRNYDYQSRLTNVLFPDSSSVVYQYDLAGRKTNLVDGAGKSAQLAYNNQGLVTNANNSFGSIAHAIFDILDRRASFTDANGVTVTNTYDALDRFLTRVWTADGIGEGFVYATNGLIAYTNRNQQVTRFGRDLAGRLAAVTNANLQATQFAFDPASHLTNLTDGLAHATAWNYNQFGWVTNKVDASNHQAFLYSYNANGWLTNRWMPASGHTQYKYDAVGNLTNIVYSNTPTAAISYFYDADNRLTNMVDAAGAHTFTYTATGQLATETGPWANDTVAFLYSQGHRTNLSLSQPSGIAWNQSYAYDNEWRLTGLTSPAGAFAYTYPNSPSALVQSLALPNAASITYQYDSLARLTNTSLVNYWGHVLDGYGYAYDALGQRTNVSRYLGITTNNVAVGYDAIGQLTSWAAKETSGTLRLNEQLAYGFDAAGNLIARTNGALVQAFSVDSLNELASVTRTGTLTLSGATPAPVTNLTVNGSAAQTYSDFTFARTNLTLSNGTNTFAIIAQNVYGVSVTNLTTANLPASVALLNDANGNLTNDGTRNFVYNAENQLTNVFVAGQWKTEFVYDGLRRKRITREYTWQGGTWAKTNETRYVYDAMLVIQERDTNNNPLVTYTRGLDLSGSLRGAGGIGGLLARTDANGSTFYHADGSGNITALIDGNQNIVGRAMYDAFGRFVSLSGPMVGVNRHWFSSMELIPKAGIYGYPRRFYDPMPHRWTSADPIGEAGGINPYRFVGNSPLNLIDPDGFAPQVSGFTASMGGHVQSVTYSQPGQGSDSGNFIRPWDNDWSAEQTVLNLDRLNMMLDQIDPIPSDYRSNNGLQSDDALWFSAISLAVSRELDAGSLLKKEKTCPKINPDKQGKHIPGHKNFQPGKSELTHPDPQSLLDRFAGKGDISPTGQREWVDTGENVGNYVDQSGSSTPTTRVTIHNAQDGTSHIVPAPPQAPH